MKNKLQYNKIYDYLQPNEISLLGSIALYFVDIQFYFNKLLSFYLTHGLHPKL